jgi:CheY-like chemotaxis protein
MLACKVYCPPRQIGLQKNLIFSHKMKRRRAFKLGAWAQTWGKHPIGSAGVSAYCHGMKKKPVFRARAGAEARATVPLQPQPGLRQSILVVDDDPITRRLNSEVLTYSGYQVDVAEDGAAAWDALLANDYDLLITDNDMPKLTGVDLLKKVRATRMALPVVMATGTLPAWEFTQYPWLRPARVVIKPYTLEELVETVQEVLHATAAARAEIEPPSGWLDLESDGDLPM